LENFAFVPLDIDLHELRQPMPLNQLIEGGHPDTSRSTPEVWAIGDPLRRDRGNEVVDADAHLSFSGFGPDRGPLQSEIATSETSLEPVGDPG
jgi:hypothetical protein